MNSVNIIGRLTKDVSLESSTSGTSYLRNSIAVDRRGEGTDFFNVTAFGKTSEFISKYFSKGSKIAISGHLQSDSYTNKDGKKVSSVSIIIDAVDFCEKKETNDTLMSGGNDFVNVTDTDNLPFS